METLLRTRAHSPLPDQPSEPSRCPPRNRSLEPAQSCPDIAEEEKWGGGGRILKALTPAYGCGSRLKSWVTPQVFFSLVPLAKGKTKVPFWYIASHSHMGAKTQWFSRSLQGWQAFSPNQHCGNGPKRAVYEWEHPRPGK